MTRELTIRAVESMPNVSWKPPHSRSFVEIVLHVVDAEYNILNGFSGGDEKPTKPLTVANYPTREALVDLLRARQKHTLALLEKLDAKALERVTNSPMLGDGPAEAWLSILVYHEVDHKGNLIIMAKAQGGNPPDVVALRQETANAGA
jgi:uncharacterized damage-inducible protein DinB